LAKWLVGIIVLALLAAGGFFLQDYAGDPFRALQRLDAAAYLDNANSLRGNRYRITGTIENSLAWSPAKGRLFSVRIEAADGRIVAVLVPGELSHLNIQKGQRFDFRVEVGDRGVLFVQEMRKS